MANRFKEQTGWCDHCNARRLVRRKDAFFHGWRCTVCGSVTGEVGERAAAEAEVLAVRSTYPVQGDAVATLGSRLAALQHKALVGVVGSVMILTAIFVMVMAIQH